MDSMDPTLVVAALERVRGYSLSLPETNERLSHGAPTFFIRDKKTFVMFMDHHHGDGRLALWCSAPVGVQDEVVTEDADQFFVPPYVGHRGWIGVRLDRDPDWDEIEAIITEAYRNVAPQKLLAGLPDSGDRDGPRP